MKRLILLLLLTTFLLSNLLATTTSSTTRAISINGTITTGAANGTNGADWEIDEEYLANDGTKFYLTWDDVNLYVAWQGATSGHQRILWIDTDPQATPLSGIGLDTLNNTSAIYGGIYARIPFYANYFINFESSTVDRTKKYNADSVKWFSGTNNAFTRTISGSDYEAKIPWDSIGGKPSQIYFLSYINNKAGGGNVPANNDGFVYGGAPTTIVGGDYDGVFMTIDATNSWFAANITSGISPFSNQGGLLPVELTSFTAFVKGKGIELTWKTATELNNYGFDVERKSETVQWEKIGFVEGNGTTNAPKEYSFSDNAVNGGTYSYRLKQIDRDGKFEYSHSIEMEIGASPKVFALERNYPNPFNPTTNFKYHIAQQGFISLKVYDLLGREVATLVNEIKQAGSYNASWNAAGLTSGVYYYQLQSGFFVDTKKMTLLK